MFCPGGVPMVEPTAAGTFVDFLPTAARPELLRCGSPRVYRRGDEMLHQGNRGFHLLVLLTGAAKVVRSDQHGGLVLLALRPPVDLVGESAVLDDRPRSASVMAMED